MSKVDIKLGDLVLTPKMVDTLIDWYDEVAWQSFPALSCESLSEVQDEITGLLILNSDAEKAEKFMSMLSSLLYIKKELSKMIPCDK